MRNDGEGRNGWKEGTAEKRTFRGAVIAIAAAVSLAEKARNRTGISGFVEFGV